MRVALAKSWRSGLDRMMLQTLSRRRGPALSLLLHTAQDINKMGVKLCSNPCNRNSLCVTLKA